MTVNPSLVARWVKFFTIRIPVALLVVILALVHVLLALGQHRGDQSSELTGDCRVELDTNRYSIPFELVGQTVDLEVVCGEMTVRWRGRTVAEHMLLPGRFGTVENPSHIEGLVRKTHNMPGPNELEWPIGAYAIAAGEYAMEDPRMERVQKHLTRLKLTGPHDDQVDSMTQALEYLQRPMPGAGWLEFYEETTKRMEAEDRAGPREDYQIKL